MRRSVMLLAGALAVPGFARAQSPLIDRGWGPAVWVQLQRPSFEQSGSVNDPAGFLVDIGGRIPLGASSELVVSMPAVLLTGKVYGPYRKTLMGNVLVGLRSRDGNSRYGVSIRLPTAPSDGSYGWVMSVGGAAEPDQIEAYLPDLVTVTATVDSDMMPVRPGGAAVIGRFGVTAFFPTEAGDVNAMGNYALFVHAPVAPAELSAGITGRIMLTNTGGADLGQRTWHQLHLGASLAAGRARPTLFVRVPLDEELDELEYVIGLGVVIGLR